MRIERDICYDELNRKSLCDIYFQENQEKNPVVLIVHGGFWSLGCKEEMQEIASFLTTNKNYTCVAIEYTLSDLDHDLMQKIVLCELLSLVASMLLVKSSSIKLALLFAAFFITIYTILQMMLLNRGHEKTHPAHIKDVAKSLEFIHHQIQRFNGDGNKVFLLGHSSGAHLVSLLALNRRFLNELNLPVEIIKGVVSISGPYSYWKMQESSVRYITNKSVFGDSSQNLKPSDLAMITDETDDKTKEKWSKIIDAWPIFHEYSIDDKTPPFLLLTAGIDLSLLYHARDFADMLSKKNAHVQNVHFDSTNHFSIRTKWNGKNKEVGNIVQTFLAIICSV